MGRDYPIAENIARIRQRIDAAARRAQRGPAQIQLMAVSKTVDAERIREAYEAGIRLFGENRVQESAGKVEALRDLNEAEWHLIGHLQSNKAGAAIALFSGLDSVDSLRLARKLNVEAEKLQRTLPVLLEINIGEEAAKSGFVAGSTELEETLSAATELKHLSIRGLMAIPPFSENPEDARPYFRKLRELRKRIAARGLPGIGMDVLSMGMSHDFEVAIEEGSTCVRIGTGIFGERPKKP